MPTMFAIACYSCAVAVVDTRTLKLQVSILLLATANRCSSLAIGIRSQPVVVLLAWHIDRRNVHTVSSGRSMCHASRSEVTWTG